MINTDKTNSGKISEALELLNEAAKEKKDEFKGLFTDRYSHIKQAMISGAEEGKKMIDNARYLAKDALLESGRKIKEVASEADERVHKNPWPYIAGTAVASLVLGYLMGSKRK